jgi:hypothetical protein
MSEIPSAPTSLLAEAGQTDSSAIGHNRQKSSTSIGQLQFTIEGQSGLSMPQSMLKTPRTVRKSTNSVMVIPNNMTESQKMEYEVVSVVSSARSVLSSLPAMMEQVDPHIKYARESSTVPNDTPQLSIYSVSVPTQIIPRQFTSSPPITTSDRKRKRAKSEVVVNLQASEPLTTSTPIEKPRKQRRSKTMIGSMSSSTHGESADELSLEDPQNTGTPTKTPSISKKKSRQEVEERIRIDELFGSDEIGIPQDHYKPRPSLRRSKSMSVQDEPKPSVDFDDVIKPGRRKRSQTMRESSEDPVLIDLHILSSAESSIVHGDQKLVKRRGRKKTIEPIMISSAQEEQSLHLQPILGKGEQMSKSIVVDPLTDRDRKKRTETPVKTFMHFEDAVNPGTVLSHENEGQEESIVVSQPKRRGRKKTMEPTIMEPQQMAQPVDQGNLMDDASKEAIETQVEPTAATAAPKKRGRPKKCTEPFVKPPTEVPETRSNKSNDEHGDTVPALKKTHANGQASPSELETLSWNRPGEFLRKTPSEADRTTPVPAQTPTKDSKKGPDQHSPLQSGKVPYRVGLSKRTRIAPLLKMIRK